MNEKDAQKLIDRAKKLLKNGYKGTLEAQIYAITTLTAGSIAAFPEYAARYKKYIETAEKE